MEIVKILSNGTGVKSYEYSPSDDALITKSLINSYFDTQTDFVEFFIFDELQNLLYSNYDYSDYKLSANDLIATNRYSGLSVDPKVDLERQGYNRGNTYAQYNFCRPLFNSNPGRRYWIKEISPSRLEIKLSSQTIPEDSIRSGVDQFQNYSSQKNYFSEFYLDFGNNQLSIAVNCAYIEQDDKGLLVVKLYEPLPIEYDLKKELWIVEKVAESINYQVSIDIEADVQADQYGLRRPNFNIRTFEKVGQTTPYYTYGNLFSSPISSSIQQLMSYYEDKGISINVDYTNFSNFVHFSSITERIQNFAYKVGLIETYNAQIAAQRSIINNSTIVSSSVAILKSNIDNIIEKFDTYEYYLYYSSESFAWPKQNLNRPYSLYSVTSSQVLNWLGSETTITSPGTASLLYSASSYDSSNQNILRGVIPQYLQDDPSNQPYLTFIDMIGQHFDNIWLYYKDISNRYNATNNPYTGISLDLVSEALKSFGISLYTNTNLSNEVFYSILGIGQNGSLLPPTGSEGSAIYPIKYVTSSLETLPYNQIQQEINKRIYHNLPYLLKSRGTERGIKALISCYGIPESILTVNEFGGYDRLEKTGFFEINNDKIAIISQSNELSQSVLSPYATLQYFDNDNRLNSTNIEIGFSPSDQINENISSSLGFFIIDDLVGNPGYRYSSSYESLDTYRNSYFSTYNKNHNVWEYIRLLKFYNNSLFKIIKDFVPARSNVSTGIIIKPHILERAKYARHEPIAQYNDYSQSIDMIDIEASVPVGKSTHSCLDATIHNLGGGGTVTYLPCNSSTYITETLPSPGPDYRVYIEIDSKVTISGDISNEDETLFDGTFDAPNFLTTYVDFNYGGGFGANAYIFYKYGLPSSTYTTTASSAWRDVVSNKDNFYNKYYNDNKEFYTGEFGGTKVKGRYSNYFDQRETSLNASILSSSTIPTSPITNDYFQFQSILSNNVIPGIGPYSVIRSPLFDNATSGVQSRYVYSPVRTDYPSYCKRYFMSCVDNVDNPTSPFIYKDCFTGKIINADLNVGENLLIDVDKRYTPTAAYYPSPGLGIPYGNQTYEVFQNVQSNYPYIGYGGSDLAIMPYSINNKFCARYSIKGVNNGMIGGSYSGYIRYQDCNGENVIFNIGVPLGQTVEISARIGSNINDYVMTDWYAYNYTDDFNTRVLQGLFLGGIDISSTIIDDQSYMVNGDIYGDEDMLITPLGYTYGTIPDLQDFLYSSNRSYIPRYEGSKVESLTYSTYNTQSATWKGDKSYGNTAAVDKTKLKYAYLVNVYTSSFVLPNRADAQIKYLIDNNQSVLNLVKANPNIFEVQNIFKSGETCEIALFDYNPENPDVQVLTNNQSLQLYEGGFRYSPLLYRLDNVDLQYNFSPPIASSSIDTITTLSPIYYGNSNFMAFSPLTTATGIGVTTGTSGGRIYWDLDFYIDSPVLTTAEIVVPFQVQAFSYGYSPYQDTYDYFLFERTFPVGTQAGDSVTLRIWDFNPALYDPLAYIGTDFTVSISNSTSYISNTQYEKVTTSSTRVTYISASIDHHPEWIATDTNVVKMSASQSAYYGTGIFEGGDPRVDKPVFPISANTGDLVKFYNVDGGWSERDEYRVVSSQLRTDDTGSFIYITLDRDLNLNVTDSQTIPSLISKYILLKHVPDETNLILRYSPQNPILQDGIVYPKYIEKTTYDNSGNVIRLLKADNLI